MNSEKGWYKMKKVLMLLGAVMISVLAVGCTSEKKEDEGHETFSEEKEEVVQIGLAVDSFVIERWIRDRDVFVAEARELGAEVNVQDAGGDAEEQIKQIEYFIQKQMDSIVVIARDCTVLADVIRKAESAGIPVISYDRLIDNAGTDLYISFDNEMVGELMAEALIEAIPDLSLIHI